MSGLLSSQMAEFVKVVQGLQHSTDHQLSVEYGKKYARVVRTSYGDQRSVFCFVDQATGDILKAASWKAPAKGKRGSILAADHGRSAINQYGVNYLK